MRGKHPNGRSEATSCGPGRGNCGKGIAIAIETHAFLNGPTAVEMAARLAELDFNCMWYEEPALPEFPDVIADIRRRIAFPVCVGERLHSRLPAQPFHASPFPGEAGD